MEAESAKFDVLGGAAVNKGAEWIIRQRFIKGDISEFGVRVAGLLDQWYYGIYHADPKYLKQADWTSSDYIEVKHHGVLSTVHYDNLTRLVFLAHDHAIRIEIEAVGGPRKLLRFVLYNRQRGGDRFLHHPSLENALAAWREAYKEPQP